MREKEDQSSGILRVTIEKRIHMARGIKSCHAVALVLLFGGRSRSSFFL
jgi:hypothetical protein